MMAHVLNNNNVKIIFYIFQNNLGGIADSDFRSVNVLEQRDELVTAPAFVMGNKINM